MSEEEIKNKIQTLQFSEIVQKGYKIMSNVEFDSIVNGVLQLQQENSQLKNDNAVMKAGLIQIRDEENSQLKEVIETLKNTNALLIKQKYQLEKDLDNESNKIEKAIKIIDSFNLGKYDYSIPQVGIIDLLEALKGDKE